MNDTVKIVIASFVFGFMWGCISHVLDLERYGYVVSDLIPMIIFSSIIALIAVMRIRRMKRMV